MEKKKILLIDEYGSRLRLRKGRFTLLIRNVEEGKVKFVKKIDVSPIELDSIIFITKASSISIAALIEAVKYGIDVVIMDNYRPIARILPAKYGSSTVMKLWLKQLKTYTNKVEKLKLAKTFAYGKLSNQLSNLKYFQKIAKQQTLKKLYYTLQEGIDNLLKHLNSIDQAKSIDNVREVEASGARWYWKCVKELLPRSLNFKKRLKRYSLPSGYELDPFNKALNIGYGLLMKEVWRAIFMIGLNPYIGFLHKPRLKKMSLVFDLMEEFRPVIDRVLIAKARRNPSKILLLKDKEKESEGVIEVVKVVTEKLTGIRSEIQKQARKLAETIMGIEEYTPYKLSY